MMIVLVEYCIGFVEAVVGWGALAGERKCRLPAGSGSVNTHTHTHTYTQSFHTPFQLVPNDDCEV